VTPPVSAAISASRRKAAACCDGMVERIGGPGGDGASLLTVASPV
jgi:hypothetical protein